MFSTRLLPHFAIVSLLAACAPIPPAPTATGAMPAVLAHADQAVRAGRTEEALALLQNAAAANPTDKAPWLRMAQLRFEQKNYGETIVNGLAVIERDPDDMLAYSLVAASGLRVATKALADLSQKNGFTGSVRREAQDLASLLHGTLKEAVVPLKGVVDERAKTPAGAVRPAGGADTPCAATVCLLETTRK